VVGEPEEIEVLELEFDEENVEHLAGHEVTPDDIFAVLLNAPRFFRNLPDRSGTHIMIGPDGKREFFYVSLAPTGVGGSWRPVTGWRLGRKALRIYNKGME